MHFTEKLLDNIKAKGTRICNVLLHVGTGTFSPIKTNNIMDHKIHSEWCHLDSHAADLLNKTRAAGGNIIAVGTTSMRILESAVDDAGKFSEYKGETDIYIKPGYEFRAADAMITNFHLPKSSLFVLVCAYYGIDDMQKEHTFKRTRSDRDRTDDSSDGFSVNLESFGCGAKTYFPSLNPQPISLINFLPAASHNLSLIHI